MDFLTTQTGYEFVYRKGVLNTGEKVTLELKEATAEQVLDALLKSRGYDYEIVDQVVVIRKGAAVYAPEIPRHVRVLQGTVKDCGGRPLPGVTVRIKGTTLGVATDQNGGYRLELPADKEIPFFIRRYAGAGKGCPGSESVGCDIKRRDCRNGRSDCNRLFYP